MKIYRVLWNELEKFESSYYGIERLIQKPREKIFQDKTKAKDHLNKLQDAAKLLGLCCEVNARIEEIEVA